MLVQETINIIHNIWPMLVIIVSILTSFRIADIIINKKKFIFYKDLLLLGFIIYIMALFYAVTYQDVDWTTSNLIPFREITRFGINDERFIRDIIGNTVMFIPYGFFISYFLKLGKARVVLFLSFITSLTIELTQSVIGRVFDVDDMILNVLGGLLGYFLYRILHRVKENLPKPLQSDLFMNIIAFITIFVLIVYFLSHLVVI